MPQKRCCFIGQRKLEGNVGQVLTDVVEQHIKEYGVTEFVTRNDGIFDLLGTVTVQEAKIWHPKVKLYLVLPSQRKPQRPLHLGDFDGVIHPEGMENVPWEQLASQIYRFMIENSDYVIAYVADSTDEAAAALEQARERERQGRLVITNLGDFSKYLKTDMLF